MAEKMHITVQYIQRRMNFLVKFCTSDPAELRKRAATARYIHTILCRQKKQRTVQRTELYSIYRRKYLTSNSPARSITKMLF